jgi:hypothetical protein
MKFSLACLIFIVCGCAALFCGCAPSPGDQPLVRINNDVITVGEFSSMLPKPTADTAANNSAAQHLLDQMIDRKLVVLEGIRLGYRETLAGAIDGGRDRLLEQELNLYASKLKPTAREISAESALMVTDSHLKLIEVGAYDTALMVADLLKQGVPFESVAVKYNRAQLPGIGPDGDLGFEPMARNPEEVIQALKTMKPGDVSGLIIRAAIHYDFIKLVEYRTSPDAATTATNRKQIMKNAGNRKAENFINALRNQVQYDEGTLDYLTSKTDSVRPEDSLLVVARLPNGYKTRIGYLLPIVRSYPTVFPYLKRRALKEDIERDILVKEALRLGLDRTADFKREFKRVVEGGIYNYYNQRVIASAVQITPEQVQDYEAQHPDQYGGKPLDQVADQIKLQLQNQQRQQMYDSLLNALKARAKIQIDRKLLAQTIPMVISTGAGSPPPTSGNNQR